MSLHERLAQTRTLIEEEEQNQSRQQMLEELAQKIHQALIKELGPELSQSQKDGESLQQKVAQKLTELIHQEETVLTAQEKAYLAEQITHDVMGYGPLEEFLNDPEVTEIMVNNAKTIYVERAGKIYGTDAQFFDEGHLRRVIDKIVAQVGRRKTYH